MQESAERPALSLGPAVGTGVSSWAEFGFFSKSSYNVGALRIEKRLWALGYIMNGRIRIRSARE